MGMSATYSMSVAGFTGAAVLVLVTDVPGPAPVRLALAVTGMGVVVLTWLALGRRVRELSVRDLYWTAAAWCLPLLFARPLFSGDVHSYHAQGLLAAAGLDPYQLGPSALGDSPVAAQVSPYWQDTPAPYGPVWLAISRTIARVAGENVPVTLLLHRLVELAGVVLIAWALPRLARRLGTSPGVALWLGLLNPLVLWHIVAGAHNDGLMIGLVLAGVELALPKPQNEKPAGCQPPPVPGGVPPCQSTGRGWRWVVVTGRLWTTHRLWTTGLVLLTVAASIKIVAAAAVLCVAAALARRHVAKAVATVVGCVGLSVVVGVVTGFGFGWAGTLHASAQVHSWLAPTNQLGFLVGGAGSLAGGHITGTAISVFVVVGTVAGLVLGAGLLWSVLRGRRDPLTGLGLVFAAMIVTGPVVQPWYLLWAILPLAACGRWRLHLTVLSAVAALLLPPIGGSVPVLVAGYLGGVVLLAVLWMASRKPEVRTRSEARTKTEVRAVAGQRNVTTATSGRA
jgi:alpha-1,6-mannosyltransferase